MEGGDLHKRGKIIRFDSCSETEGGLIEDVLQSVRYYVVLIVAKSRKVIVFGEGAQIAIEEAFESCLLHLD